MRRASKGPIGRRIAADYEITVFEPNRRLEFRTTKGPGRPHGRYDFGEVTEGTRLTFSLDAQPMGLWRLILGGAMQATMDAEVKNLNNLKRILEA
jgi:hypothetical protein